jgi:hypothetical protein
VNGLGAAGQQVVSPEALSYGNGTQRTFWLQRRVE